MNNGHANGASDPVPHRELPHSDEAEVCVLSACMFPETGGAILERCIEANITPSSFYDSKHGLIFEALLSMREAGIPIEAYALFEAMRDRRTLESVGGLPFITQVTGTMPSTATAAQFISRVRDQSVLRGVIREATRTIETAYSVQTDIGEFTSEVQRRFAAAASGSSETSAIAAWAPRRAGVGRIVKDEEPTLFLGKVAVANRGNIELVTALRKSGKTALCGGMLGAVVGGMSASGDCLGFRAHNLHRHAVIHLDTEQSPKDHEHLIEIVRRRSGVDELPPWLYSYGVKGVPVAEQRRKLHRLLKETNKIHHGIYLVVLDGIADLVNDPNDPKECNPFVSELELISSDYNCSITCLLHLNPPRKGENTKGRGHLGSQLERKCETELRIVTDTADVSTVYTECARHTPISQKDGPRFSWDHNSGMHASCGAVPDLKSAVKREKAADTLDAVLLRSGKSNMGFSEFLKAISDVTGLKPSGAEDRFYQMKSFGLIEKNLIGTWSKVTP